MSTQQAAYVLVRRDGVIAVIADSDVILVAEHGQCRQVVAALVTHRLSALATVMLTTRHITANEHRLLHVLSAVSIESTEILWWFKPFSTNSAIMYEIDVHTHKTCTPKSTSDVYNVMYMCAF